MRKKLITKILLFIFVFIFISLFISSPLAFRSPRHARAENVKESGLGGNYTEVYPRLSVPVGEFGRDCAGCYTSSDPETCFKQCKSPFEGQDRRNWLGVYIIAWFNYIIGAVGIFAVYRVMYGGILWITAGGNASQVDDAKGKIKNAVIGIVLLLCTYTIFKTINPRMLSLQLPPIEPVKEPPKVCCLDANDKKKLDYACDEKAGEKQIGKNECVITVDRFCTSQDDNIPLSAIEKYKDSLPNDPKNSCGHINKFANCMYISVENGICAVIKENSNFTKGIILTGILLGNGAVQIEGEPSFRIFRSKQNCESTITAQGSKTGLIGSTCPAGKNCWAEYKREATIPMISLPKCE